jgi:hypothetical protein
MAYTAIPGTYLVAVKGYYENQTLTGAFYINRFYKWRRDGVDIPGADGPSYGVTTDDIGSTITCVETVWHTVEPNNGNFDANWTITNPLITETPGVVIIEGQGSAAGLLGPQNISYVGSFRLSGAGTGVAQSTWNFGLDWPAVFNDGTGVKKLNLTASRVGGHNGGTVTIPPDAQLKSAFTNAPGDLNPTTVTVQPNVPIYIRHDGNYYNDGLAPRPGYGQAPVPLRENLYADGPEQWNTTTGSPGRSLYQIPGTQSCIVNATTTYGHNPAGLYYRRPTDMTVTDPDAMEGPFVPIQTGVQENARMHCGYILSVPSTPVNGVNYQTALDADVLTGVCSLSVVAATSDGPSMFGFKTSDITPTLAKAARGNIVSATTTTFQLDSSASSVNDFYKGFWFYIPQFMSGNPYFPNGGANRITAYNGATKTATVDTFGVSSPITFTSKTNPVRVNTETPFGCPFFNGVRVTITNVAGMTQLNGNTYYMKEASVNPVTGIVGQVPSNRQYDLYTDAAMTVPVDGTGFGTYVSGGEIDGISSVGHYYKIFPVLEGTMLAGYQPGDMSINGYARFEELATVWADGSTARSMIWPAGSKSVIAIGSGNAGMFTYNGNGEIVGPTTFQGDATYNGPKIYDPMTDSIRGPHIFPRVGKMWAFNADDLVAVKNGQKTYRQVGPYSAWSFTYPYSDTDISGVTYDDDTKRLYISQNNQTGGGSVGVVHVYQITV